MDQEKQIAITSLFEVVSSIERKWANEWNNHNVLGFSKS
ncbi:RNA polymerase subunit sigma, partial [Lysinibacillus xylanilyticus]